MAVQTLFPLDRDAVEIGPDQSGAAFAGCRIAQRRLKGGLREGVRETRIENGRLSLAILPTRGMGLWKVWLGDEEFGWKSPVPGPVHPALVPLGEGSGLGWLDGFDELLVRCGLESNGAPEFDERGKLLYPLHGRIANKPAEEVAAFFDAESGEFGVRGIVHEVRFHFLKLQMTSTLSTRPGSTAVTIRDEIRNLSGLPAEAQMLYHVNFGLPLLDPGARVVAPVKTLVPRDARAAEGLKAWDSYPAPEAGFAEQVYFFDLLAGADGRTQALLKNAHATRGVSLRWKKKQLPCFTLWKDTAASPDGYVTGLEPGTNFPNPRSYEGQQARVLKLPAGGTALLELELDFHGDAAAVEAAEAAVAAIQAQSEPRIYEEPQAGWCAGA